MTTSAERSSPPLEPMDPSTENDIVQFVRLDTEMKRAKKQMRGVRATLDGHRQNIIQYMVRTKTDKLVGINGDTQYLECSQKTLKRRATAEQMLTKLAEMLKTNITDPQVIFEALQNCGGTYTEYRLFRRTRRVNAASMAAAVVAANRKKLHRPPLKKRRQRPATIAESVANP